ncbi:hypothetical protein ILYODFUR_035434 [Ilyodon furcidens]|uniref:Hexosyltransferase n=1 Tax=Ilyodon furcidens TaxID=33524 RepID=A0ABV0TDU1_9TELE
MIFFFPSEVLLQHFGSAGSFKNRRQKPATRPPPQEEIFQTTNVLEKTHPLKPNPLKFVFLVNHAVKLSSDITTERSQMWQNSWGFDLYYIFPAHSDRIRIFRKIIHGNLKWLGKTVVPSSL